MSSRIPLVAAILFAISFAAALVMVPALPGPNEPGTAVVSHLAEHARQMRVQALLVTLGTLALVVVMGYARDRLEGPAAHVFTVGSAVVLAEISVQFWFSAGLALHADTLDPDTARAIVDVASLWGPILTAADVMLAVPIVLAARAGRFPRWLGVIAAVFAVEQFIEIVTIVGPSGTFIAPGGTMNLYVGGPLFVLFLLTLGIASSQPVTAVTAPRP